MKKPGLLPFVSVQKPHTSSSSVISLACVATAPGKLPGAISVNFDEPRERESICTTKPCSLPLLSVQKPAALPKLLMPSRFCTGALTFGGEPAGSSTGD